MRTPPPCGRAFTLVRTGLGSVGGCSIRGCRDHACRVCSQAQARCKEPHSPGVAVADQHHAHPTPPRAPSLPWWTATSQTPGSGGEVLPVEDVGSRFYTHTRAHTHTHTHTHTQHTTHTHSTQHTHTHTRTHNKQHATHRLTHAHTHKHIHMQRPRTPPHPPCARSLLDLECFVLSGMLAKDTLCAEMPFMFAERGRGRNRIDYPVRPRAGAQPAGASLF